MPNPALTPYLSPEAGGALNSDLVTFMVGARQGGIFGGMQAVNQARQAEYTNRLYQNVLNSVPLDGTEDSATVMRKRAEALINAGFHPQGKNIAESANLLSPHETFGAPTTVIQNGTPQLMMPGSRGNARIVQGVQPYERGEEAVLGRVLPKAGITEPSDTQPFFRDLAKKLTSHQPAASVDVKVNSKVGEGLASKVGDIATSGRDAASGAVDVVDTVQRVSSALQSGNVNLGPGSTVLNRVDQVAQILGVGGQSTEERLVNTRNVIRGLAQFTMGARKSLKGQGQVSDYEGKLLTRAESGEINDFTIPELRDFLKVTDRIARKAHSEHKRILGVMGSSKDEAVRGLVPYFDVPDLPAPMKDEPKPATKVIRYDATGKRVQ